MKVYPPDTLKLGRHYKKILTKKIFSKWCYQTLIQITFVYNFPVEKTFLFKDEKGVIWAELSPTYLKIYPRYAWNGCSPKGVFFGICLGTPDFNKTMLASLIHDILTQFDPKGKIIPRKTQDRIFKEILTFSKFKLRGLYYSGARVGSIF